jgi:hypothetical protein
MNEKLKVWGILGGVSLLTISLIYIVSRPKKSKDFKKKLIRLANEEHDAWNVGGKRIKEGDSRTLDRLRKYWQEGSKVQESDYHYINEPWSASFISYIMRKAGAGNDFKYAQSHSQYIAESIKNRKENKSANFKGYKPNEVKVKVGDLVCYPREAGVSYESLAGYKSHCDLITEINGNIAIGIGGNVSDSVTKKKYVLKDGKIDKSKDDKGYGGIFAVIKNYK